MDLDEEIKSLRRYLDELAAENDHALERYELSSPRMPPGFYWRVRWVVGWTLRWLESLGLKRMDPWPAALKHHPERATAAPLLIWAAGSDRDELRKCCLAIADLQSAFAGFVPVLVTDVADFAFFSRLGWLVEYLPALLNEDDHYDQRKLKLIARLYRGAPAFPANVALRLTTPSQLRQWLPGTQQAPAVARQRPGVSG